MKTFKVNNIEHDLYKYEDGKIELTAYIDIETVLGNLERVTNLEELAESKNIDMYEEQDVVSFLEEMTAYEYVSSDNSYNWDSDFSSDINFSILSADKDEWYFSSGYLVIRIHQGGDIRGNYSKCRIYKYHGEDDAMMFLDSASVEVRFNSDDEIDEYTVGYQNNPLYHFNEDFKIYGVREDGTILCRRLSDNKRFKAYLDNRANY